MNLARVFQSEYFYSGLRHQWYESPDLYGSGPRFRRSKGPKSRNTCGLTCVAHRGCSLAGRL